MFYLVRYLDYYIQLLFFHIFLYCNIVWGGANKFALSRLLLLQKRALRIISKSYYLAHTDPLFKNFKLLKLDDVLAFQLTVFMYRTKHSLLPHSCTYATFNTSTCPYNLRKRKDFTFHPFRTMLRKKHVTHAGPYAWESLPDFIKQSDSLHIFKSRLLTHFLDRYG